MITPDHWFELDLADRLRLAALELELGGYAECFSAAVHEAADLLERFEDPPEDTEVRRER